MAGPAATPVNRRPMRRGSRLTDKDAVVEWSHATNSKALELRASRATGAVTSVAQALTDAHAALELETLAVPGDAPGRRQRLNRSPPKASCARTAIKWAGAVTPVPPSMRPRGEAPRCPPKPPTSEPDASNHDLTRRPGSRPEHTHDTDQRRSGKVRDGRQARP